jgi:hypothetical protein
VKGIDLLEGRVTDGSIQVGGDWVQIMVGDNAQNLALGKNVTQQQITAGGQALIERLDATLQEFLDYLDERQKELLESEEIIALKQQIAELRQSLRKSGLLH